jgi:D-sedoheptulose 7-phosphate isomerase
MDIQTYIAREIQDSIDVKIDLLGSAIVPITTAATRIADAMKTGKKLLIFGNGGSAADAQHIAAEMVGRYQRDRKALPAIALTVNSSVLTAVSNDYGFDDIFTRQIEALGSSGDIAIAISTSGNSPNVLKGLEAAHSAGLFTIGLSGKTGGKMISRADLCICIPSETTARVQEAHILIGHILCGIVEQLVAIPQKEASVQVSVRGTTPR